MYLINKVNSRKKTLQNQATSKIGKGTKYADERALWIVEQLENFIKSIGWFCYYLIIYYYYLFIIIIIIIIIILRYE